MRSLARLRDASLLALLGAAVVAVARQRREAARVVRGELPPASAAADLPSPAGEDRLAAALARWQPRQPRSPWGRVLAVAWAAPLSLGGLALAVAGGGAIRYDGTRGCLVATGVRGPVGAAMAALRIDANAAGHIVLCRQDDPPDALLAHEAAHVRQAERLGPTLPAAYIWLSAVYGYRDNPLERAARRMAQQAGG